MELLRLIESHSTAETGGGDDDGDGRCHGNDSARFCRI
jgi:hypothetical protein